MYLTASQSLDRVADHLEALCQVMPRETSNLCVLALRLDRVANTLEKEGRGGLRHLNQQRIAMLDAKDLWNWVNVNKDYLWRLAYQMTLYKITPETATPEVLIEFAEVLAPVATKVLGTVKQMMKKIQWQQQRQQSPGQTGWRPGESQKVGGRRFVNVSAN
jgi:hypothetical protein